MVKPWAVEINPKINFPVNHHSANEIWLFNKILYNTAYYVLEVDFFRLPQLQEWNEFIWQKRSNGNSIIKYENVIPDFFQGFFEKNKKTHLLFVFEISENRKKYLLLGVSLFNSKNFYSVKLEFPAPLRLKFEQIIFVNDFELKTWKKYYSYEFLRQFPP